LGEEGVGGGAGVGEEGGHFSSDGIRMTKFE
jgi:hypothetical protein